MQKEIIDQIKKDKIKLQNFDESFIFDQCQSFQNKFVDPYECEITQYKKDFYNLSFTKQLFGKCLKGQQQELVNEQDFSQNQQQQVDKLEKQQKQEQQQLQDNLKNDIHSSESQQQCLQLSLNQKIQELEENYANLTLQYEEILFEIEKHDQIQNQKINNIKEQILFKENQLSSKRKNIGQLIQTLHFQVLNPDLKKNQFVYMYKVDFQKNLIAQCVKNQQQNYIVYFKFDKNQEDQEIQQNQNLMQNQGIILEAQDIFYQANTKKHIISSLELDLNDQEQQYIIYGTRSLEVSDNNGFRYNIQNKEIEVLDGYFNNYITADQLNNVKVQQQLSNENQGQLYQNNDEDDDDDSDSDLEGFEEIQNIDTWNRNFIYKVDMYDLNTENSENQKNSFYFHFQQDRYLKISSSQQELQNQNSLVIKKLDFCVESAVQQYSQKSENNNLYYGDEEGYIGWINLNVKNLNDIQVNVKDRIKVFENFSVSSLALFEGEFQNQKHNYLLCLSHKNENKIKIVDIIKGTVLEEIDSHYKNTNQYNQGCFLTQNIFLVGGENGEIFSFKIQKQKIEFIQKFESNHKNDIIFLKYDFQNDLLLSGDTQGLLLVWDKFLEKNY
ncbi:WD40-repeat-containing domain [Pseudocohnilembus persalinus]|uniref:WD40-repeat-containing domain n=1 Tax=Pseudocohnilembus persalinus TaxID=266149 RepID=A0A0V0R2X7_PSEPJ|nr:WD40-repeat-containing domain [Pseudocohnilembus persalinus]|eukprot:KRX08867.1 WD40-repeat-containing domain [Pseudocohnilembus persalinus]